MCEAKVNVVFKKVLCLFSKIFNNYNLQTHPMRSDLTWIEMTGQQNSMNHFKEFMKSLTLLPLFLIFMPISAQEIVVRSPEGCLIVAQIDPGTSFNQVIEHFQEKFGEKEEFLLDFALSSNPAQKGLTSSGRDYNLGVSSDDKKDISMIVNTLGLGSLIKIAKSKSALKRAGKRIDPIHPLQFLACVFSDDSMKVAVHAMRNRGWIWGEFFGGLKESLEEEFQRHNLRQEQIADFSLQLNISSDLITPVIQERRWSDFISILIDTIPRNEDSGRYDM